MRQNHHLTPPCDYDRIDREIGRDGSIPLLAALALIALGAVSGYLITIAIQWAL